MWLSNLVGNESGQTLEGRIGQEQSGANLVKTTYRFTIESEAALHTVTVKNVESLERAAKVLRVTFPYEQWRIVNIAETLSVD